MSGLLELLQDSIEKEIQKNKMKIAEENFIYDIANKKPVENSECSKKIEKCVEELVKRLQNNTSNDILKKVLEENKRLKEELAKSKRDYIKINFDNDIETVKDI